jgi:protein-S-isoprenylcysteine O-methyltransferase Ste14
MLKGLSIIGYVGMIGGAFGLVAAKCLFSSSPIVIAVQAGSSVLLIWARLAFGRRSFHAAGNPTEGGLVTSGPYRYIRHAIYTAFTMFCGAGVIAHWCWVSGLLGALVLGCALLRVFCEEFMVTVKYPEYRQYAAVTWRMIPYIF